MKPRTLFFIKSLSQILFLSTLIIIIPLHSFSQGKITYEYGMIKGTEISQLIKIHFYDSSSAKSSIFDLYEDNPYNNLGFSIFKKDFIGNNIYIISKAAINEIIPSSGRNDYTKDRKEYVSDKESSYIGSSYFSSYKKDKNRTIVGYSLIIDARMSCVNL